ncbi:ATP-binding protein [Streptomyces sp. TRM66268-LWL]|uniref:ATP-binding protein n=1 Tax=Streptomyces polyasparticus TaxID=2767826 RepID=A0ABR7SXK0_9ACTN|nr:ATP-binding protein [Streptomyces polyasparticus]
MRQPLLPADHLGFSALFATTEHGAHSVRHAAERWLAEHLSADNPHDEALVSSATLLIAELTANAALHGHVRGREARLRLCLDPGELRIEVTDARGDVLPAPQLAGEHGESGRGLVLVTALSDEWGVRPHHPGGKTVWAVCRR